MTGRRRFGGSGAWLLLAMAAASMPVLGALSATRVFYVRDLGVYFWPQHLWMRRTILAGDWPLWNPYAGGGQSAVADALNQFFLLPVSLARVALPDIPGFNLWIAAPFPLIALGAWLWLRRHASAPAACVGAACLALAGPVVSSGNFPNLSWAVACVPWILWAAERLTEQASFGRFFTLAVVVAMQVVTGEPITIVGTGVVVLAHTAYVSRVDRVRRGGRVVLALAAGAFLSSMQTLPLLDAASRSPRESGIDPLFWSLHPLELVEGVAAHLFGHSYETTIDRLPWVLGMHRREPFFFSVYVGLGAIVLAAASPDDAAARRVRRFWAAVACASLLCALGGFTPIYPALQAVLPPLQSFRFPAKFAVFACVALAMLTATGADALIAHTKGRGLMRTPVLPITIAAVVAIAAALLAAATMAAPASALSFWEALGRFADLDAPREAAGWILSRSTPLLQSVAALGVGVVILLIVVWQRHPFAPFAAGALCALAVVDPLVVNRDLHPTMAAKELGPPEWVGVARRYPGDRVYIGGRVRRVPPEVPRAEAIDTPPQFEMPAELPPQEALARLTAQFSYVTAAWGVREATSYDLPQLRPREYAMLFDAFRTAAPDARLRFLRRVGVRYCFLPQPPEEGMVPVLAPVPLTGPMALYECGPNPQRASVVREVDGDAPPEPQIARLFDAAFEPASAGDARIVRESNNEVVLRASADDRGYLTLFDSYDAGWRVEVDGQPAPLLRAYGLFRAVALARGDHEIRFSYRPAALSAGLVVTLLTLAVMLAAGVVPRLTAPKAARRMRQAADAS